VIPADNSSVLTVSPPAKKVLPSGTEILMRQSLGDVKHSSLVMPDSILPEILMFPGAEILVKTAFFHEAGMP